MSDLYTYDELEKRLGEAFLTLRLKENVNQAELASRANVSVSAVRLLENGAGVNVKSLIRIAKALGKTDWLLSVNPTISINPLHMVPGKQRQRASSKRKKD